MNHIEPSKKEQFRFPLDISNNLRPITFCYSISQDSPEQHVLHINQFYEIYIYIQGDTDYIVGDSCFSLQYGDIIIINPYEVHKAVIKSNKLYERFYFLVPTNSFSCFSFNPLDKIMSNTFKKEHLISLPECDREKAFGLLYQMLDVLKNNNKESGLLLAYGLFLQFISMICMNSFKTATNHIGILPRIISDILKYIDTNLTQIDSVEQIAAHFNVSLPYLSTTFKNAIGTSTSKYIQTRRIAYAKILLDKGMSVTDACYESGFNDCAYFIKIFKRYTGMTPLQYRKTSDTALNLRNSN